MPETSTKGGVGRAESRGVGSEVMVCGLQEQTEMAMCPRKQERMKRKYFYSCIRFGRLGNRRAVPKGVSGAG